VCTASQPLLAHNVDRIPAPVSANKLQLCAQVNRPVVSDRVVWFSPGKHRRSSPGVAQALWTPAPCEIGTAMLWTVLVVLFALWLLGVVTSYTFGGFIHVLLLVALALFVINLIQGRRRMV
jgi:Family of unknown function (DUF5670)